MKANKINTLVLAGALLLTSTGGSYAGQRFSTLKGTPADMTKARFNNVMTITLPSQRNRSVAETFSTRIGGVDVRYQTEVPAAVTVQVETHFLSSVTEEALFGM